jgi:hypothetical protein
MHGHDGGVDAPGAVRVLLGQPGAREWALRIALATCRAQVEITVVGQRAVHDQCICAGRGCPLRGTPPQVRGGQVRRARIPNVVSTAITVIAPVRASGRYLEVG